MALTNSQVQQVYLAITGRPAEGNAVTWASSANSVADLANAVIDLRKNSDFTSNEQFVNHLYQYLLNDTAPDAAGVKYWTDLLKGSKAEDGTEIPAISKAELIEQFINAVMAQNQTDHKYTLENKTQIAVEFGDDVKSFVGGKQAETYLRDVVFNHVDKNTSYADIEEYATNFKGQYVNVANVTVTPGAEEPTEGSETNASNYNATITLGEDEIAINGSVDYGDTLNLKVKGTVDNQDLSSIGSVSGITNLNIDMNDSKAATTHLSTTNIGGATNLVIKGSSEDTITVDSIMNSIDTGAGVDNIILGNYKATSLQAGAGADTIDASGLTTAFTGITIDGGAGNDTLKLGTGLANATIKSIEKLSGTGNLAASQVNGKSYTLADSVSLTVEKATNGVNLSNLKVEDGATTETFNINGVKSGTVKLLKIDGVTTTDTIDLTKATSNVRINNFNSTDDTIKLAAGAAVTTKLTDTVVVGRFEDVTQVISGGKASADLVTAVAAAGQFTAKTDKGYIAQAKDGKTFVYQITNDGTNATQLDAEDHVKLIATIDAELGVADFTA